MTTNPATGNPRRWLLGAALAYAVLTAVFTWPMPRQLDTHVFGARRDAIMFLWNTWWAPHAVQAGGHPLRTEQLFYPEGTRLVIHTHAVLPALLSAPLQWLFGLVPAFNLTILLTYVFAGLGTYLLVSDVVGDRRAGLVAGAMYAFCHTRTSMILFLNLIQTQFLALYVWALWRAWQRASGRWAVAAAALLACVLYSSYNLFLFALLWTALFALFLVFYELRNPRRLLSLATPAALVVGVTTLLAVPMGWEIYQEIDEHGYYVTKTDNQSYDKSVPLSRLLLRGPLHGREESQRQPLQEASFLGYGTLAFAVLGVVTSRRRAVMGFWLLCAVLFLWCSLGARLNWDAASLARDADLTRHWPMPYATLRDWPLLKELRNPHRFGLVGALALTVLAGFGLRTLWGWLTPRMVGKPLASGAVLVSLLGVVVFDFLQVPFPKTLRLPATLPVMEQIASDPRDCCVLEFPAGRDGYPGFSYYETFHDKPVYRDGQLARTPPHLERARNSSEILGALSRVFGGVKPNDAQVRAWAARMQAEIETARIGWVILSWVDSDVLWNRRKARPRAMEELDRQVRRMFDVTEATEVTPPEDITRWQELSPGERKSAACIFAVYKVRLPGEPQSSPR